MSGRDDRPNVASSTPFDNSTNGFESEDVQAAIEELENKSAVSASPGFSFGRGGALNKGVYLYRPGSVVSSKSGINVGLYNAILDTITVTASTLDSFSISVVQHDGLLTNTIVVGTYTVPGGAYGYIIPAAAPLTRNKQLAIQISTTSANKGKDLGVDLQISGTKDP